MKIKESLTNVKQALDNLMEQMEKRLWGLENAPRSYLTPIEDTPKCIEAIEDIKTIKEFFRREGLLEEVEL